MAFLRGLLQGKPKDTGPVSRVVSGSPNSMALSGIGQQPWDIDRAITEGIDKVIWAFRCVDAIATNASEIPINIVSGYANKKQEVLDEPRIWKLMNVKPNTYESAQEFRYRLSSQLLLSRRGAFIEMVMGNDGKPSELHLLPAGRVMPIPGTLDEKKNVMRFVDGYKVMNTSMNYMEYELAPERVIWVKAKPHPTDPYMALTPFLPASLAIETDYFARLFNNNFLKNDGRPSMIVSVQGHILPDDAAELKRRFTGGPTTAGSVSVIEADGIDIADLTTNPRDIQWLEGIRESKQDILLAFGVPESILGNASGSTFDNADAEYEIFWVHTMKPHCKAIATKLDVLTDHVGDEVMLAYDFDSVDVLQRAENKRKEAKAGEVQQGLATVDEYLELVGRKPWDIPATRVLFLTSGIIGAKNEADQKAVSALLPVGTPPTPIDPNAIAGQQQAALNQSNVQWNNIISARAARLQLVKRQPVIETKADIMDAEIVEEDDEPHHECPYNDDRYALEGQIAGLTDGWSSRQAKVFSDRMTHVKVRKFTRHWEGEPGNKALNSKYIVEVNQWADELTRDITRAVKAAALREAKNAARDMGNQLLINKMGRAPGPNQLARIVGDIGAFVEEVTAPVQDMIYQAAQYQLEKVVDKIEGMDGDGASLADIQNVVSGMTGGRSDWQKSLSIGASTMTMEGARAAVYGSAGPLLEKTWRSQDDERVRPTHASKRVNGKTIASNKKFTVGGAKMNHPGDPTAPIGERINCRCYLEWTRP